MGSSKLDPSRRMCDTHEKGGGENINWGVSKRALRENKVQRIFWINTDSGWISR